ILIPRLRNEFIATDLSEQVALGRGGRLVRAGYAICPVHEIDAALPRVTLPNVVMQGACLELGMTWQWKRGIFGIEQRGIAGNRASAPTHRADRKQRHHRPHSSRPLAWHQIVLDTSQTMEHQCPHDGMTVSAEPAYSLANSMMERGLT